MAGMKTGLGLAVAALSALALGACAEADRFLLHGAVSEAGVRRANERLYRADVKACGHGPGAEWCRLAADDRDLGRAYPFERPRGAPPPEGVFVYDISQCAGPLSRGRCLAPLPPQAVRSEPVCHGQVIAGVCSGPTF